jgi:3',5'-cyclic AMP phosphodiesterase CpdA
MSTFKTRLPVMLLALVLCTISARANTETRPDFIIKPYLQLGNHPKITPMETAEIDWFAQRNDRAWKLEIKQSGDWSGANVSMRTKQIFDSPVKPLYEFRCEVKGLIPGTLFDYRVLADGKSVFGSWAKSRKNASMPYRFDVFGDCGSGTVGQKLIAWQCYSEPKPDFVVIPGDIVYQNGLFSEYLRRFFPVYNNNAPDQLRGCPLMRSIPFIGIIGNHDAGVESGYPIDLKKFPDGLAYFVLWHQPLNGPLPIDLINETPAFRGGSEYQKSFLASAGENYPRSAMFSFDYGSSHWTVLDGDPYVDWRNLELRKWVENDISSSQAKWKFVSFHQPAFSFDAEHAREQRMRLLADIFQRTGVDLIFAGHAHDYQRTKPITFHPQIRDGLPYMHPNGTVSGETIYDKQFDGIKDTTPHGLIHIVTGGGGALLYGKDKRKDPEVASPDFIDKFVSNTHSLTRCEVNGSRLELRQISENGAVIDHITITK